jgi:hypothetical protein
VQLTEEIRNFVNEKYIKPARKEGKTKVTIVTGEVHSRMNLKDRMPAVCNALRAEKFQTAFDLELIQEVRPPSVGKDSSTNQFIFELL